MLKAISSTTWMITHKLVHSFHSFSSLEYIQFPPKSDTVNPIDIASEIVGIVSVVQLARGLIKSEIYILLIKTWHPIPAGYNKNEI